MRAVWAAVWAASLCALSPHCNALPPLPFCDPQRQVQRPGPCCTITFAGRLARHLPNTYSCCAAFPPCCAAYCFTAMCTATSPRWRPPWAAPPGWSCWAWAPRQTCTRPPSPGRSVRPPAEGRGVHARLGSLLARIACPALCGTHALHALAALPGGRCMGPTGEPEPEATSPSPAPCPLPLPQVLRSAATTSRAVELMPTVTKVVDLRPSQPGRWRFYCDVHDHQAAGGASAICCRCF